VGVVAGIVFLGGARVAHSKSGARRGGTGEADVVIVGAGVAGASVGLHLATAVKERRVVVLERGFVGSEASGLSAGTIHDARDDSTLFGRIHSGTSEILRGLEELGFRFQYIRSGSLTLARNEEELSCLEREFKPENGGKLIKTAAELHELEPLTKGGSACGGLLHPASGHVDPKELTLALVEAAEKASENFQVREGCEVIDVELDRISGKYRVHTSEGKIECKKLVLCPGAWSTQIGEMIGVPMPVFPVKGEIWITDETPEHYLKHIIYVAESKLAFEQQFNGADLPDLPAETTHDDLGNRYVRHAYGRRLADGRIIFGGDRVPCPPGTQESDLYVVEERMIAENQAHVYELLPKLAEVQVDGAWAGPMPFSLDGKPIVGHLESFGLPNLFVLTGLGPHGIMDGPMLGKLLAEEIENPELPNTLRAEMLHRFDLQRFFTMTEIM